MGAFVGALGVAAFTAVAWAAPAFGGPRVFRLAPPDELLGVRYALAGRIGSATAWLVQVMSVPLCLVLTRRVVRSEIGAGILVTALISSGTWWASPPFAVGSILLDAMLVATILRFGLLAGVATAICTDLLLVLSFAFPVSGWAASSWIVPFLILVAVVILAVRGALSGHDVMRMLED